MNIGDLQGILDNLDREKSRLQDRLSEIDRDREQLLSQLNEVRRLATKYNVGGTPMYVPAQVNAFDGSLKSLSHLYVTDPRSPIHALRHATRQNYSSRLSRIEETFGDVSVGELTEDHIIKMYDVWSGFGETIPMGHAVITMLRTLAVFGAEVLKDDRCQRLSYVLHRMKFKPPTPRSVELSLEQNLAVIAKANELQLPSIGLAQALQYWTPLLQKDCIGEWVPDTEPEPSSVTFQDLKWVRGIRWEQIDSDYVLHHSTSREHTNLKISLSAHPAIMTQIGLVRRQMSGPVIVSENSKLHLPWRAGEFRRYWRKIARLCNIPDEVKNRDSASESHSQND